MPKSKESKRIQAVERLEKRRAFWCAIIDNPPRNSMEVAPFCIHLSWADLHYIQHSRTNLPTHEMLVLLAARKIASLTTIITDTDAKLWRVIRAF